MLKGRMASRWRQNAPKVAKYEKSIFRRLGWAELFLSEAGLSGVVPRRTEATPRAPRACLASRALFSVI